MPSTCLTATTIAAAIPARTSDTGSRWYLYIIETVQGKLYTGITTDIQRRFEQHRSGKGGAKFFRTDPPLRLRFSCELADRSRALKLEYKIKQLNRKQKLVFIEQNVNSIELDL